MTVHNFSTQYNTE